MLRPMKSASFLLKDLATDLLQQSCVPVMTGLRDISDGLWKIKETRKV
jgi:hypothetical protein